MSPLIENALYLLALLNPASKIMFLAAYSPALNRRENWELSWKSSTAALLILMLLAAVGQFVLSRIFRVELFALQITGGLVVFCIGWTAVGTGHFVRRTVKNKRENMTDISLVPLAAPLIAGPGMIAASISGSVQSGLLATWGALLIAVFINFLLMLMAEKINRFLTRTHLLGPLIRLTGLIIAAVAMQMICSGLRSGFPGLFR